MEKSRLEKRVDALETRREGVGEAVGNHSERFNYYDTTDQNINIIDDNNNGVANRAGGQKNRLTSCNCIDVYGYDNLVEFGRCAIIRGDNIKLRSNDQGSLDSFIVVGRSIDNYDTATSGALGAPISSSAIFGRSIQLRAPVYRSLIVGDSIDSSALISNSLIAGLGHNINAYTESCIVSGKGAAVTPTMRLVIGRGTYSSPNNIFQVDDYGDVTARTYNTWGADYAEMFEWADGNRENADRRGMLVALYGDLILPAHGDDFFGIVSAAPSVIGNNPQHWHKRYKKDVFGAEIRDEKGERIESDEYDPKREYIPRSERPEWSPVGFVGRLVITDDGSCKVGGYVSARNGIGTKCYAKTAAKVLKRIDEKHVEVLLKAGW